MATKKETTVQDVFNTDGLDILCEDAVIENAEGVEE